MQLPTADSGPSLGPTVSVGHNSIRGFVVNDDAAHASASAAPTLDIRSMVVGEASRGAIGDGIQSVGTALDHINTIRSNAINQRHALEAEASMTTAAADIGRRVAAEAPNDPDKWPALAQQYTEQARKQIITPNMSPVVRDHVEGRFGVWQAQTVGGINVHSAAVAKDQLAQTYNANFRDALQRQDYAGAASFLDSAKERGVIGEAGHIGGMTELHAHQKAAADKAATEVWQKAVMDGDKVAMEAAITHGAEAAKWTPEEQQLKRTMGEHGIQNTIQAQQNKSESAFVGNFALARSMGGTFSPEYIQKAIEAKQIDAGTGAQLLEANKRQVGADDKAFQPFLTKVMAYDPEADAQKLFAGKKDLDTQAALLGLNQAQMGQYQNVFEMANKVNGNALGRAQSGVKVGMHGAIDELATRLPEKTNDRTAEFLALLKDENSLYNFGITDKTTRQKLSAAGGLEGPAAIEFFRDAAKGIVKTDKDGKTTSTVDPAHYKFLTDEQKQLFADAVAGKLVTKTPDVDAISSAKFSASALKDQANGWWEQFAKDHKRTPSEEEARGWLMDKTKGFKVGNFWESQPKPATAAPTSPGDVSIRGFQDAPDLADKLPANLKPYAADFIAAAKKNDLDPYALAAISIHETDHGTSSAFTKKNNAMGSSNDSGPLTFASVPESIERQAKTLAGPIYKGADTIGDLSKIYAPVGASNDPNGQNGDWPRGVSHFYQKLKFKNLK